MSYSLSHYKKRSWRSPLSFQRSSILTAILLSSLGLGVLPALTAELPAGTEIINKATGSFEDEFSTGEVSIESNTVKVTVAEVAGINVVGAGFSEAPASVTNAGSLQGDGTVNMGDVAYFDYTITNIGNDPTQFFIPDAPSSTTGGTFNNSTNPIQIISYNPNGTTPTAVTGVTVPIGGQRTGPSTATGTDGLLGKNGIILAGGSVTIRVPLKVTAAVGQPISMIMGNTPPNDNSAATQNQAYTNNSSQDIYTQDNLNATTNAGGTVIETAGVPINGIREASANQATTVAADPINISGTIFEDVNYGGGAGRNLLTASGVVRPNVRVELYDANGNYLGKTLTDINGEYLFNVLNIPGFAASNTYQVRVVNNFVTSSRAGACAVAASVDAPPLSCIQSPVQTFRTNGLTGNLGTADPNRVGGEQPAEFDAPANTTSQTISTINAVANQEIQSLTTVALGTSAVSGINFGYNFDTIVNTKDSGQGSLRQFIINSNALGNGTLAQVGQTAGQEVSIFMVPSGAATPGIQASIPSQLTSGVAIFLPTTPLPQITAANTSIDGSTQTNKVSDTNTGALGYAGSVGTGADGVSGTGDEPVLTAINKPEVEIQGISGNVLDISGTNAIIRGVAIRGTNGNSNPAGIQVQPGANNFLVENSIIGSGANTFADPGAANRLTEAIRSIGATSNVIIRNNLVGYVGTFGIISNNPGLLVERNRFTEVGQVSWLANSRAEQMRFYGDGPATIKENHFDSTVVGQIDLGAGKNVLVDNNTLINGHSINTNDSYENGAIHARGGADLITISHNIISNTQNNAHGIMVHSNGYGAAASRVKITQNSIFNSGKLGINLNPTGQSPTATNDGVTPNDGLTDATAGNNGMDYPIITSSILTGSTMTIKGFVGSNPAGSPTFANATLEFFVADNDGSQNGAVIVSDGRNLPHGEGKTYLGTCTADGMGLFGTVTSPCSFNVPTGTNPLQITSTATDSAGNTSEFSAAVSSDPNVLLVKRITAINGSTSTVGGNSLAGYIDEPTNAYDDNAITIPIQTTSTAPAKDTDKWPSINSFLLGGIDGGRVKPNDVLEYTIYFLSAGDSTANKVMFCDRVPGNVTFIPGAFNTGIPAGNGGLVGSDRGIAVNLSGTLRAYTSANDDDFARYYPPGIEPGINCGGTNTNGAVVVNLGDIPHATTPGTTGSYGFVRFRGRVR
jgi:uncharacterized repeat protein (TIGR01451 family)